jgi:hypothetical protein
MTAATTIEVLQKAAEFGLKLGFERPDTLTFQPANRCPIEFAITLKAHKPQLLSLLRLPFYTVYSKVLSETVFFCEDEPTKEALVEAGASEWSIYTFDELRILLEQNRVAPLSDAELRKVHEIKRTFNGTVTRELDDKLDADALRGVTS